MYIKLDVYWAEDNWENKEDLGLDIETSLGTIYISTDHIVSHHPTDYGDTMIRCTNGECFRSPIEHTAFVKLLNELVMSVELKLTDN